MKLQKIALKNFRGSRDEVSLALKGGQSLILYGDNGTGKSSFADAIEWFVTNNVSHLDGEEIEKHGGLRNALAEQSDECFVEIDAVQDKKGKRTLSHIKGKLTSQFTDKKGEEFAQSLEKECLLIRNRELVSFILETKSARLLEISSIIGFEDIVNAKDIFKKAANGVKSILKSRGFENQISAKKALILQKLQATINTREQFFSAIEVKLRPFKLDFEVKDEGNLEKAKEFLKAGSDQKEIKLKSSLELCSKGIKDGLAKLLALPEQLEEFIKTTSDLQKDHESIKQISLGRLLDEVQKILQFHDKDQCPLCLKPENRETLLTLIKERIAALKQAQEKLKSVQTSKDTLLGVLSNAHRELKLQLKNLQELSIPELDLKPASDNLTQIEAIEIQLKSDVLKIDVSRCRLAKDYQKAFEDLQSKIEETIKAQKGGDSSKKADLFASISVCEVAFNEIEQLEKEKTIIEEQRDTLDKILSKFVALQRDEMKAFLARINAHVNDYFLFMNQGEKIDAIELSTVDNSEGEFAGIAIQLKFHKQLVLSPKKFLSESYLNCLGLCVFLASVKLFNSSSKFFILDDVISSFDKAHRLRFGHLLAEKFSDYQILILTHESEWFEFMANLVKSAGWKITRTQWNAKAGISLEVPAGELKTQIEERIQKNDENGLGNLMRRYAERLFKELCLELEAEVKFRFNEHNERRMLDELFSSLRGRLNDKSDLSNSDAIKRLASSKFITNQASHDSSYKENIHDLKAVYKDLADFESLLRCSGKCKQRVSTDSMNKAKKTISCKCGDKEISWKN